MATQYSTPGVYIEEQPGLNPIAGVATSFAAFLGPTRSGDPNVPTFITSFDEFRSRFGNRPLNGFYLWYAVRGFFENGGRLAHIVRVSTGAYDFVDLVDSRPVGAQPTLRARARELGPSGITVTVEHDSYVTTTAFRPAADIATAAVNTSAIVIADPADRRPPPSARCGSASAIPCCSPSIRTRRW